MSQKSLEYIFVVCSEFMNNGNYYQQAKWIICMTPWATTNVIITTDWPNVKVHSPLNTYGVSWKKYKLRSTQNFRTSWRGVVQFNINKVLKKQRNITMNCDLAGMALSGMPGITDSSLKHAFYLFKHVLFKITWICDTISETWMERRSRQSLWVLSPTVES